MAQLWCSCVVLACLLGSASVGSSMGNAASVHPAPREDDPETSEIIRRSVSRNQLHLGHDDGRRWSRFSLTDEPAGPIGVLVVTLLNGRDLVSADSNGLSDPYCLVRVHHSRPWRSVTRFKTLNPDWNDKHAFEGYLEDQMRKPMSIHVYDKDLLSFNDPIGRLHVDLSGLRKDPEAGVSFMDMQLEGVPHGRISFTVHFQLQPVFALFPGTPLHASAAQALRRRAPADASSLERCRDKVLRTLTRRTFLKIAVLWLLNAIGWVVLIVLLFLALHLGAFGKLGMDDSALKIWFNIAVKVMTGLFSYLNGISVPWRLSIAHHLFCSRRSCAPGRDFYGRPTEALWFLLPIKRRRLIAVLLLIAVLFHYANQAAHIYWSSYEESMEGPTAIPVTATFLLSVLYSIIAGVVQGRAESQLIKQSPGKFPPGVWADVKEVVTMVRSGQLKSLCSRSALRHFIRLKQESARRFFVAREKSRLSQEIDRVEQRLGASVAVPNRTAILPFDDLDHGDGKDEPQRTGDVSTESATPSPMQQRNSHDAIPLDSLSP